MTDRRPSLDDPVGNVRRGWGRRPSGLAAGTAQTGLTAALWTHGAGGEVVVSAEANRETHSICLSLDCLEGEVSVDSRMIFDGVARGGSGNIVVAGETPRGVFKGNWRLLHAYMPRQLLDHLIESETSAQRPEAIEIINPRWTTTPQLARIGLELLAEMNTDQPFSQLRVDALGLELGIALLRFHSNAALPGYRIERGGLAPWQYRRVRDAMDAAIDSDIGLAELAEIVGLTPSHFARAFKQATGIPPFAFFRRRRIDRAKELLADDRLSLTEVALAVGFAAQAQFTTAFRRATGLTPGQWRRTARS